MSERKPSHVSWESWIDRQIRESQERGEFDHLPGAGEPLPSLGHVHDEMWWVKKKMREEKLSRVPPTLAVRKERDEALARVARAASESDVRRTINAINARIIDVNAKASSGPPSRLAPLDVEEVVTRWREMRPRPETS